MAWKTYVILGAIALVGGASAAVTVVRGGAVHRVDRQRPATVFLAKRAHGSKIMVAVPRPSRPAPVPASPPEPPQVAETPYETPAPVVVVAAEPPVPASTMICTAQPALRSVSRGPDPQWAAILAGQLSQAARGLPANARSQDYMAAFAPVAVSSGCGCPTLQAAAPQLTGLNRRARNALLELTHSLSDCPTGAIGENADFAPFSLPGVGLAGGSDYSRR